MQFARRESIGVLKDVRFYPFTEGEMLSALSVQ